MKIKTEYIAIAALLLIGFFLWQSNRQQRKEIERLDNNISAAYKGIETRFDNLGNKFAVVEASVFTKQEFEQYAGRISDELKLSGIKTKNIISAGLAGIESNYHFTVLRDTTIILNDTTIIESYRDKWITFEKIGDNATVTTTDTVLYSTFKERNKSKAWLIRWLYKKQQKELFKSLSPYSDITFLKVNNIK